MPHSFLTVALPLRNTLFLESSDGLRQDRQHSNEDAGAEFSSNLRCHQIITTAIDLAT